MKSTLKFFAVLFVALSAFTQAQTADQAKAFINRTHIAISKAQKEMLSKGRTDVAQEFKNILNDQSAAVKQCYQQNLTDALSLGWNSRSQVITLLNKVTPGSGDAFNLDDTEKTYCKPTELTAVPDNKKILSQFELDKIQALDVMNPQKLQELRISIR